jgi:predicted porin
MKRSIVALAVAGTSAFGTGALAQVEPQAVSAGAGVVRNEPCEACNDSDTSTPAPRAGEAGSDRSRVVVRGKPRGASKGTVNEWHFRVLDRPLYVGLADRATVAFARQYSPDYQRLNDIGSTPDAGGGGSVQEQTMSGAREVGTSARFSHDGAGGLATGRSYGFDRIDGSTAARAWGMTVGVDLGPVTLRAAHQNRHVARVQLYDRAGNNLEAQNSLIAANMRFGWGSAYVGYSINRGWVSSPLFNPDNPYGAGSASTSSGDSRDLLAGVAVPVTSSTTLLASFIHKNDRDLANRDANELALGATYTVSRHTDFYAAFTRIQNTNSAGYTLGGVGAPGSSNSAINLGMRHQF